MDEESQGSYNQNAVNRNGGPLSCVLPLTSLAFPCCFLRALFCSLGAPYWRGIASFQGWEAVVGDPRFPDIHVIYIHLEIQDIQLPVFFSEGSIATLKGAPKEYQRIKRGASREERGVLKEHVRVYRKHGEGPPSLEKARHRKARTSDIIPGYHYMYVKELWLSTSMTGRPCMCK